MSIKIEIPGDYLEIFFVANGECMWKYGRILQFLVANATILVAMYSVGVVTSIVRSQLLQGERMLCCILLLRAVTLK